MKTILSLLLSFCLTAGAFAQSFDQVKMDSLFSILDENNMTMASVSILQDGKEVYRNSIGFSQLQNDGAPIQSDEKTLYSIGSISKSFTATMIMQLVEEGEISLGTPLSEYYPQVENSDVITIEDLLRHSSGIFNFTNAEDFQSWMFNEMSREDLVEKIVSYGSDFDPGTRNTYSNSNYVLLSFILEDVTGKPYNDLLQERICVPCHLQNTYLASSEYHRAGEANSFYLSGTWQPFPTSNRSIPVGAGAVVSTAFDINSFYTCLFSGTLVSNEVLGAMKDDVNGYGIGMFPHQLGERKGYGHSGAIDAFTADVTYYPEDKVAIAITVNGQSSKDVDQIAEGVTKIYFGLNYTLPEIKPTAHIQPTALAQYEGEYKGASFPLMIKVYIGEDGLMAQAEGQGAFPLRPVAEHKFVFDAADLEMTFDPAKNTMTFTQGGGSFTLSRE